MIPQVTIQLDKERAWRASAKNSSELFKALGGQKRAMERIQNLAQADEDETLAVLSAVVWSGIMLDSDCPPLGSVAEMVTAADLNALVTLVMPVLNEGLAGRPTPAAVTAMEPELTAT